MLFVVLTLSPESVQAGQDKNTNTNTPSLSLMPSAKPSMSPAPSDFPSLVPSLGPTGLPTVTASQAPTEVPTIAPSSEPSISSEPSDSPPTQAPTVSIPPTIEPTITPPSTVSLPEMTFTLNKNGTIDDEEIGQAMDTFMTDFLSTGLYKNAFQFIDIVSVVEQDDTVATLTITGGTAQYSSLNSNDANDPVPTAQDLTDILATYFSFWGDRNLQEFLVVQGFSVQAVSMVALDGEVLSSQGDNTDNDPNRSTSPDDEVPPGTDDDSEPLNNYVIAGIVAGGFVVLIAMFLFVRGRIAQNEFLRGDVSREVISVKDSLNAQETGDNHKNISIMPTASAASADSNVEDAAATLSNVGAAPHHVDEVDSGRHQEHGLAMASNSAARYPVQQQDDPIHTNPYINALADEENSQDDYTSDGDIISVTESLLYSHQQGPLFNNVESLMGPNANDAPPEDQVRPAAMTGKTSARAPPQPAFQYDASRLDQVISSAKGNQKDMK